MNPPKRLIWGKPMLSQSLRLYPAPPHVLPQEVAEEVRNTESYTPHSLEGSLQKNKGRRTYIRFVNTSQTSTSR